MAGSMRQRGERSWELRVFAGNDPETGKKQYVTKTVRGARREAERELARLVAQVDDGTVTAKSGTVGELIERWYAKGELEWSPTTADGYRAIIDRRLLPRWGETSLRRLKAADLDSWYTELRRSGGPNGGPLAANSVKRIHGVLRTALELGVKWGWLATNPAAAATPASAKSTKRTIPKPADVARLIDAAREVNPWLPAFLRLAAATGARRGELCGLRWDDIDLDAGTLVIERSMAETRSRGVVEKDTKTHAERRLTLDPGTVQMLVQHRAAVGAVAERCGGAVVPVAFVFSHEADGSAPWRPNYVTLAFSRLRDECGLPGVRLHDLRHFNATSLLANGADLRTVSGRLGHANASTTLDSTATSSARPTRRPPPPSARSSTAEVSAGPRPSCRVASLPLRPPPSVENVTDPDGGPMSRRLTFTVTEAAEILGIAKTTAYQSVLRGELPSLTFGRRIVITRRDLEELVGPLDHLDREPAT